MTNKNLTLFIIQKKVQKFFFIHNRTEKPLTSQNFKYSKRSAKFSNQKRTKPRSMLPFQEGMGEMSHKQQNLILTSL